MSAPWFILPEHLSPSVSTDCSGPTKEGHSPACRVSSRRGCPGDLCMTPRTCCLSVLAHGVPVCPKGRIDSFSDQRLKVGWPPAQRSPTLVESLCRDNILCTVSKITPCFSQKRSLQRTQVPSHCNAVASVTPSRRWNSLLQPELDRSHVN